MNTEFIWVHRRHADYPTIQVGFRWVTPEIAARMITDGCAQNRGTDSKRLKYKTEEVFTPEPVAAAAPEPVAESPPVTEPVEEETPAPKPKRRTYKRRDVTAEQ